MPPGRTRRAAAASSARWSVDELVERRPRCASSASRDAARARRCRCTARRAARGRTAPTSSGSSCVASAIRTSMTAAVPVRSASAADRIGAMLVQLDGEHASGRPPTSAASAWSCPRARRTCRARARRAADAERPARRAAMRATAERRDRPRSPRPAAPSTPRSGARREPARWRPGRHRQHLEHAVGVPWRGLIRTAVTGDGRFCARERLDADARRGRRARASTSQCGIDSSVAASASDRPGRAGRGCRHRRPARGAGSRW